MKLKILFITLLAIVNLNANQFLLNHDGLIDKRAQDKILQIGTEAKTKLNANIFIHIIENNGIDMKLSREQRIKSIRKFDKRVISMLPKTIKNYAILTLAIDQMYANILVSDTLKDSLDKNDILKGYVIPLLASKDKNSLFAKTSAACLNGYAQIADSIANKQNMELESSIGSEGKTASTIWRVFMYTLVISGIILYTIIVLRQRKNR